MGAVEPNQNDRSAGHRADSPASPGGAPGRGTGATLVRPSGRLDLRAGRGEGSGSTWMHWIWEGERLGFAWFRQEVRDCQACPKYLLCVWDWGHNLPRPTGGKR